MATSKQILDMVGTMRWTGISRGKAAALQRFSARPGQHHPRRRQFFDDVQQVEPARKATYIHPAETAVAASYRRDTESDELTPAELVWLQRLPLDPAQVTHADAARLAGMAGSLTGKNNPSSRQLVQSIWQPVKEVHDLAQAKQELDLLRPGLPAVPASAREALREALVEEHPDWPAKAVDAQAEELMQSELSARETRHQTLLRLAEETVEQLSVDAAERIALVRESA